ncbi:MAG TPA: electron transfer flavoprotein subunit alpha/FixB family protein [Anaerolineae bacterium]|nr:electron transfer flavoprotein subunit alpha/FixB family protein [Anaerolineae bacterium]
MDWTDIWTLAEYQQGKLRPVSFELLTRGRALADARGCRLCSVVLGDDIAETELRELLARGADCVYAVDHPALARFLVEPYAKALRYLIETYQPEVLIAAATTTGRTVMPYLSMQVHTGLTADCTGLEIDPETGNLLQTRPAIGGNIMATIKTPTARPQMATVRPKSTPPAPRDEARLKAGAGEIVYVDVPTVLLTARMRYERFIPDETQEVMIEDAEVIVAGGRGMKRAENFQLLADLANVLGGSVGATRAAVDRGWQAYPRQIGLSGKTIASNLYIACGISGAIQHLAGMQTAEHIIAINTDPDAPIFQVADLGIVGDVFEILPAVLEKLKEAL